MGWSSPDSWLTRLFSGDPLAIAIAFLVTLTLPALLHYYFYTQSARSQLSPTFLLLGASGAGKTSLVSLLQKQSSQPEDHDLQPAPTRTSQIINRVSLYLPPSISLGSNKYRSVNDVSLKDRQPIPYTIVDTPGHGKLRLESGLSQMSNPALRGVIFVVDSSVMDSSDSSVSRDAAAYLHDTLLALQRRTTGKGTVKGKAPIPLLIAANKQDLFTSLPAGAVSQRLQSEIERVRVSRAKGLSAVGRDADADEDDDDVLGGGGEDKFTFKLLEDEYGIKVDIIGGSVKGQEAGKGVTRWEEWIGDCL